MESRPALVGQSSERIGRSLAPEAAVHVARGLEGAVQEGLGVGIGRKCVADALLGPLEGLEGEVAEAQALLEQMLCEALQFRLVVEVADDAPEIRRRIDIGRQGAGLHLGPVGRQTPCNGLAVEAGEADGGTTVGVRDAQFTKTLFEEAEPDRVAACLPGQPGLFGPSFKFADGLKGLLDLLGVGLDSL